MNPVSGLIPSPAPAPSAGSRSQASREEQAAFSPALMMLLAAGLAPAIPLPSAAVPEPLGVNDAQLDERALAALELGLDSSAEDVSSGDVAGMQGSPPLQGATTGTLRIPTFQAVAAGNVTLPETHALATTTDVTKLPSGSPAPAMQAVDASPASPATRGAAQTTTIDATPNRGRDLVGEDGATALDATVHIESRSISSPSARPATAGHEPAPATVTAATAAQLGVTSLPDFMAQTASEAAAPRLLAIATLATAGKQRPTSPGKAPVLEPNAPVDASPQDSRSSIEGTPSGASVLDSARRAAAIANHPAHRLKRTEPPVEQTVADTATPEPVAAGVIVKPAPGGEAPADREAPVQQAPEPVPSLTPMTREAAPAVTANEGFSARSTLRVPEDPRLDSLDGARNSASRLDQVTLRLEGEAGEEARLRVAVRGRDMRATIATDDPSLARRLEDGLGTLRTALGDRGFERAQLQVQGTPARTGDASHDTPRDSQAKQRQQDADSPAKNGKQSETPEQRSRSRNGRNPEGR